MIDDAETTRLKTTARRLFQQLSVGQLCVFCEENEASESHHCAHKGKYEALRYMPINAIYSCHFCHVNEADKFDEWSTPGIPNNERYMINQFKRVLLKDYLSLTVQSEKEHLIEMIGEMKRIIKNRK